MSPRRAALAVFVVFFLSGLSFASWASRLPAVRDHLELTPQQVGLLLLVGAVGSMVALPLSGLVVERLGARTTIRLMATVAVVGLLTAALAVDLRLAWLAAAGLAVYGVGIGVWDAAMNLEGAVVEQRLGRALMPRLHAGFSLGTIVGAALGAAAAWGRLSVLAHLAMVLVVVLVAAQLATRHFLPDAVVEAATPGGAATGHRGMRGAVAAWREPRTVLLGVVVMAAALTEGAANDWVSLAVVDDFEVDNAVGAVAFALFVTAMTGMRLLGTALLNRWGRVQVLRLSAGLAITGLLIFGLVPTLSVAMVGIVLWGMGAALGFPVGMSAASDDPRSAPARVAVVSTIGYAAFFAGPPLLGLLAEHVGYRSALLAILVPVAVGLLVARVAAPLRAPGDVPTLAR